MKTPIDRVLYDGKYLYVLYSKGDERITFSFPRNIDKKEWGGLQERVSSCNKNPNKIEESTKEK